MSDRHGWEDDVRPARYRHADTVTYEQAEEIVAAAMESVVAAVDALRDAAEQHKDVTEGRIARFGRDLARAMAVLSRVMDPEAWEQRSDLQLGVVASDLEVVKVRALVDHERRFAALEARVAELEGRS